MEKQYKKILMNLILLTLWASLGHTVIFFFFFWKIPFYFTQSLGKFLRIIFVLGLEFSLEFLMLKWLSWNEWFLWCSPLNAKCFIWFWKPSLFTCSQKSSILLTWDLFILKNRFRSTRIFEILLELESKSLIRQSIRKCNFP